jgi:hypothetical protein
MFKNRWVYFWKYLTAVRDLAKKIWGSYGQGGSMHSKLKAVLAARGNTRRRAAETITPPNLGPNLDNHLDSERRRRRGSDDILAEDGALPARPGIMDNPHCWAHIYTGARLPLIPDTKDYAAGHPVLPLSQKLQEARLASRVPGSSKILRRATSQPA